MGQSSVGAATGHRARARPGKSLNLSESTALSHCTGVKVSLQRWRGPWEIIWVLMCGGPQARKQRAAPRRHGAIACVTACPWLSLLAFLGSVFLLESWDTQHIFPDSVSWGLT